MTRPFRLLPRQTMETCRWKSARVARRLRVKKAKSPSLRSRARSLARRWAMLVRSKQRARTWTCLFDAPRTFLCLHSFILTITLSYLRCRCYRRFEHCQQHLLDAWLVETLFASQFLFKCRPERRHLMFLSRTLICSWERRWWLVSLLFGTTVEFGLVGIARRRLLGLMVKLF